jgi:hypothetical protein
MNAPVDEGAEERKGGAGGLGKMLLSAGEKVLAIVCHVPKALQESNAAFNLKEWVEAVREAAGGKVTEEGDEVRLGRGSCISRGAGGGGGRNGCDVCECACVTRCASSSAPSAKHSTHA